MENKKVYCSKCIYYVSSKNKVTNKPLIANNNCQACCTAPQNIKREYVEQYSDRFIASPKEINQFNNCHWYQNIKDAEPKTIFDFSSIVHGPYEFQLTNSGANNYDLELIDEGTKTYKWVTKVKDILWQRDLYKVFDKNTKIKLNGFFRNFELSNMSIKIKVDLISHDIILPLSLDEYSIGDDETIVFEDEILPNIAEFNKVSLSRNDSIVVSIEFIPSLDEPTEDPIQWKTELDCMNIQFD